MKSKSKKQNSSQANYKKYFDYRMGKGKPEKLKNAVLQHPDDTDDSIYGYMQKNKSRNMWVMNFDQYDKVGGVSESLDKKNPNDMVMDYNQFNKVNEDEWTDDLLSDLSNDYEGNWWEKEESEEENLKILEKDLMQLIKKHSGKFGVDSYGVIDAIYQVMDGMFERVEK